MDTDDPASPARRHLQRASEALYLAQLALMRARELIGQDAELAGQLADDIAEVRRKAQLAAEIAGLVGTQQPVELAAPTRLPAPGDGAKPAPSQAMSTTPRPAVTASRPVSRVAHFAGRRRGGYDQPPGNRHPSVWPHGRRAGAEAAQNASGTSSSPPAPRQWPQRRRRKIATTAIARKLPARAGHLLTDAYPDPDPKSTNYR